MAAPLRIALAQIDTTVGDIAGNVAKIQEHIARARHQGAELVVFPELAVTGYPPEDLLLKEHFLTDARAAVERLAAETNDIVALVGFPERAEDVYNAAAVLAGGEVRGIYRKTYLPNYGVFDEERYFQEGTRGGLIEVGDAVVGLTICEDIWEPGPPLSDEALAGATVVINLSASPYYAGKGGERENMLVQRARDSLAAVAFCNLVGGQDELVFDGHSVVIDDSGEIVARAAGFAAELLIVDVEPTDAIARRLRDARRRELDRSRGEVPPIEVIELEPRVDRSDELAGTIVAFEPTLEQMRLALTLGLRDYVEKNGFADVVLGVSGGIDSAVTAALCVEALGADRVHCVSMPSRFSSDDTRSDARLIAEGLDCAFREIPIEAAVCAFTDALAAEIDGGLAGLAAENLQARVRGVLLMALSNTYGWLVVSTGNKSELAVGYSTLYGDMVGGFALLKDVFKTDVYRLAEHLNERANRDVIPRSTIERAPSAELRDDQRDSDSIPAYDELDPVLEAYVEEDRSREELVDEFDPAVVERAVGLVDRAEYKRRQAPPGVKLRPKAFGRDRRTPITNRWAG